MIDDLRAAAPLLQVEHALAQRVAQLARLDAEIFVRVLGHPHALACGRMRRMRSRDSPLSSVAVCRVWLALVSASFVARATLAMAMLTCSTALDCCLVDSSISLAASVVVPTMPAICLSAWVTSPN